MQTKVRMWLRDMNHVKQICIVFNKITFHLQNHCKKIVKIHLTSNIKKMTWTSQIIPQTTNKLIVFKINALWVETILTKCQTRNEHYKTVLLWKNFLRIKFINNWTIHWMIYQRQLFKYSLTQKKSLNKKKWNDMLTLWKQKRVW